ncbi:MAG: hypothetical protein MRY63_06380 [Neomegalonema sp.]|nr:hypothetical protein [Neomegalonema sp.]
MQFDLSASFSLDADPLEKSASDIEKRLVKMERDVEKHMSGIERRIYKATKLARKSFEMMGKATTGLQAGLGRVALGAGVAATGITALVSEIFEAAEAVADAATFTGVSVEALQELRFVADQNNMSIEELNDALKTMTNSLGAFKNGGGPAVNALEQLGLSQAVLNGELDKGEDAYIAILTQLTKVRDEQIRNQLAAEIFGEAAGSKLRSQLELGIDGIAELRQEARDLGIVMNGDLVRRASAVNAEFRKLWQTMRNNLMGAILEMTPEIEDLANSFADVLPDIIGFLRLIPDAIRGISDAMSAVGDAYDYGRGVVESGRHALRDQLMEDQVRRLKYLVEGYEPPERRRGGGANRQQAVKGLRQYEDELSELQQRRAGVLQILQLEPENAAARAEFAKLDQQIRSSHAEYQKIKAEVERLQRVLHKWRTGEELVPPKPAPSAAPGSKTQDEPLELNDPMTPAHQEARERSAENEAQRRERLADILSTLIDDTDALTRDAVASIGRGSEVERAIAERQAALRQSIDDVLSSTGVAEQNRAPLLQSILSQPEMATAIERYAFASQRASELSAAQDLLAQSTLQLETPQQKLNARLAGLASLKSALTEILGSEAQAQDVLAEATARATDEYFRQSENLGALRASVDVVSDELGGVGSELYTALRQGDDAANVLLGTLGRIADRIAQIAIEQYITAPLTDFLKTAGNSIFASVFAPSATAAFNGISSSTGFQSVGSYGGTPSLGFDVLKRATGGPVVGPGTGTSDSIPMLASNGEYVINAHATRRWRPFLDAINFGRGLPAFASGGLVSYPDSLPPLRTPSFAAVASGAQTAQSEQPVHVTINNHFEAGQDEEAVRQGTLAAQRDIRRLMAKANRRG